MVAILITGVGGYIGGSILADLYSGKAGLVTGNKLHAAVRSDEQAESLSELNVGVLRADLNNSPLIEEYVLRNEIDIIINAATSIDPDSIIPLIHALGKRQKSSRKPAKFIHVSGLSALDPANGWTFGAVRDTDAIFDMEKTTSDSYIVRKVDTAIVEAAKAHGVNSFIVMPGTVHGRGSGTWNRLSPQLPGHIRASIANKRVSKFRENREVAMVHVSDLTTFFACLVNAILKGQEVPSDEQGYYFVTSYSPSWWDVLENVAQSLHNRGLVRDANMGIWPSNEAAGVSFDVPAEFAHSIFNAGCEVVGVNAGLVGWQPVWNCEKTLAGMDSEIDDVLELGQAKSGLLGYLKPREA